MEVEKLHVLKVIPDAIQGNGLHVQDNSRWQCPTWLWYFLWRLSALGPHRMWLHRGLSWLLHVFSLRAGTEVGSRTFKKRSRDKLLSEQGSSISLGFLWTWRHSAPLRFGLWPLAVSSLHPQVNPTSKTMGCRWKSAGKQPHSHTRSSVTTQYSSCWHYSLFSYCFSERKIRSTSFSQGNIAETLLCSRTSLICHRKGLTNWQFSSDFPWAAGEGTYFLLQKHSVNLYCSQLILLLLINVCSCNALKVFS